MRQVLAVVTRLVCLLGDAAKGAPNPRVETQGCLLGDAAKGAPNPRVETQGCLLGDAAKGVRRPWVEKLERRAPVQARLVLAEPKAMRERARVGQKSPEVEPAATRTVGPARAA